MFKKLFLVAMVAGVTTGCSHMKDSHDKDYKHDKSDAYLHEKGYTAHSHEELVMKYKMNGEDHPKWCNDHHDFDDKDCIDHMQALQMKDDEMNAMKEAKMKEEMAPVVATAVVVEEEPMTDMKTMTVVEMEEPNTFTWVVEKGDTLSGLAAEHGVSGLNYSDVKDWMEQVIDLNDITDQNLIFPGQELILPKM